MAFGRSLLVGILLLTAVRPLAGQVGAEGDCEVPDHDGFTQQTQSNGSRIFFFRYPTIRCSGGTWINADSARIFEFNSYSQLFGNVIFRDGDTRLTADEARYFSRARRLRAWGSVVLTDLAEGSEFHGDTMVLVRAGEGREEDELTVTGSRPHATLYPTRQQTPSTPEAPEEGPPALASPDSMAAAADSVASPPDSVSAVPDSVSAVPDTVAAVPDSVSAVPDSLEAVQDSAAMGPDSLAAVPDSLPGRTGGPETGAQAAARPPPEPTETEPAPPETEEERVPYEIDAQRFFLRGSGYFVATGGVLVERDSLDAVADSLEYDESTGSLLLSRNARMRTSSFDLSGGTILLDIPGDDIRQVDARRQSVLEGEDLRLLAPSIVLFLEDGAMERLVAKRDTGARGPEEAPDPEEPPEPRRGGEPVEESSLPPALERTLQELGLETFPARPFALADEFQLIADSIEALAPGEVLREVLAMGSARGVSFSRDSLNTPDTPDFLRHDWLEGDTIIATFLPPEEEEGGEGVEVASDDPDAPPPARRTPEEAPADSAGERFRLERLVARVGARSLYRLEASDSTVVAEESRPAIHYVIGQEITILMSEGEVERMEVTGATMGIHGEPVLRRNRPDTVPDTTGVARRGGGGKR